MVKTNIIIHPQYANLETFIQRIPKIFDTEGETLYQSRNVVKRYKADDQVLVVKRYKHPLFFQRFDYTFIRPSKAQRAYLFGCKLKELHISTPEAVAYIEIYKNGFFFDGYFISGNCCDPDTRILRQENFDRSLANALAGFLTELHRKGFLHGDLNLSNILYHPAGNDYAFTVIDTNRSKFVDNPSKDILLKNLMRLTHQRDLLAYIIRRYAQLQKWDEDTCVRMVFKQLKTFERKRKIIRFLKGKK